MNARDTVFRINFNDTDRKNRSPFISMSCSYHEKTTDVLSNLYSDLITEEQALEDITILMEEYYNTKYPLFRGFNH